MNQGKQLGGIATMSAFVMSRVELRTTLVLHFRACRHPGLLLSSTCMNAPITLSQRQLPDFFCAWQPRVLCSSGDHRALGKSSLVEQFAASAGLPCVSLLGSQLAPEEIIGVPQIADGKSRFCPPAMIARTEPYCLFLDGLNACAQEVMKSFYSLIHDRRVGDYYMPKGSIVIGAGNRTRGTIGVLRCHAL